MSSMQFGKIALILTLAPIFSAIAGSPFPHSLGAAPFLKRANPEPVRFGPPVEIKSKEYYASSDAFRARFFSDDPKHKSHQERALIERFHAKSTKVSLYCVAEIETCEEGAGENELAKNQQLSYVRFPASIEFFTENGKRQARFSQRIDRPLPGLDTTETILPIRSDEAKIKEELFIKYAQGTPNDDQYQRLRIFASSAGQPELALIFRAVSFSGKQIQAMRAFCREPI